MPELFEIMDAIKAPVSDADIRKLPAAAGGHDYIPWQAAYGRMDRATGGRWDYSIVSATAQGEYAVVVLRLRVWDDDGQVRDCEEVAAVPLNSQAPPFEVATRSAVKRAMSVWGYARNLWQGQDHGQDFDHYSQRRPDAPPQDTRQEYRPRYEEGNPPPSTRPADGFPEGQCEDCGRPVKTRNDGSYWSKCYECNQRGR